MPLRANLNLDPKDAIAFFAAKGDQLAFDYTEVWREANVHAFTVAKATTEDVLRTIRGEVEKAIGSGQTFEEFKRTLRPRLQDLGWWGTKEVLEGDTGEITKVQLGSERRLRTIYQTNVQTAYMAGRYKRLVGNAGDRPFWRYVAVMDSRTRPAHAALHGRVWRSDDPIWQVIFPPNGWGCRCRVMALSEGEFNALKVPLEATPDAIATKQARVGRDGDQVDVQGIRYTDAAGRQKTFFPDPGWDYNPGEEWSRFDPAAFAGEDIAAPAPPERQTVPAAVAAPAPQNVAPDPNMAAASNVKSWQDYNRPALLDPAVARLPMPLVLPAAGSPEDAATVLSRAILGFRKQLRIVDTPVGQVPLKPELLPGSVAAATGRERFANFVVPTLESPFEVWLTPYADGVYRRRFLSIFDSGTAPVMMVLRENRDGSLAWSVYELSEGTQDALDDARKGMLLYGQ